MASSQTKIFKISLSKDLFVDPSFSKKYSTYLPLKKSFLNSRLVDKMSPTCLKLVLILLDHAHNVRSTCFDLASDMFPSCREPVENVLLRLERYQVLTEPPLLINELKKEVIKAQGLELKNTTTQKHWFEKFVIEELGSLDTGLCILSVKTEKCFGSEAGFREWLSGVTSTKKFKEITADEQLRYFKKSLNDEMKTRGFA